LGLKSGLGCKRGSTPRRTDLQASIAMWYGFLLQSYKCNCQYMNFNNLFSSDYNLVALNIIVRFNNRYLSLPSYLASSQSKSCKKYI
jgi:hypothetical protein